MPYCGVINCANSTKVIGLSVIACLVWALCAAEDAGSPTEQPSEHPAQPVALMDRSSHHSHHITSGAVNGFWRKKISWRPRWVKTWQPKKVYVAVWKRMWGPVEVKEWVPVPSPPAGWAPPTLGHLVLKQLPHH